MRSTEEIRSHFPALDRRHRDRPVAYFDGPGGTQVPRAVVDAMTDYLLHHNANTHWRYPTSQETDAIIAGARRDAGRLPQRRSPDEIAFGANMTTLTFHLARGAGARLGAGRRDRRDRAGPPRQRRSLAGAGAGSRASTIRCVPHDPGDGAARLGRPRAAARRAHPAARHRRGVQRAGDDHRRGARPPRWPTPPVPSPSSTRSTTPRTGWWTSGRIGCDFLACSAYKFYGPHVGVLYGRAGRCSRRSTSPSSSRPRRPPRSGWRPGTQNHEGIAGRRRPSSSWPRSPRGQAGAPRLRAAFDELHRRGQALLERLLDGLGCDRRRAALRRAGVGAAHPDGRVHRRRRPAGRRVADALADEAVFVSTGDFYATTVVERYGLGARAAWSARGARRTRRRRRWTACSTASREWRDAAGPLAQLAGLIGNDDPGLLPLEHEVLRVAGRGIGLDGEGLDRLRSASRPAPCPVRLPAPRTSLVYELSWPHWEVERLTITSHSFSPGTV